MFILLSLATTVPTLTSGYTVVHLYHREAWKVWKMPVDKRQRDDWLILGINTSFAGSVVDNLYWGLAWLALFYGSEHADTLFLNGVFSNLIFRQFTTFYGARCHVLSAGPETTLHYKLGVAIPCAMSAGIGVMLWYHLSTGFAVSTQ